jgi:hypothetical protein
MPRHERDLAAHHPELWPARPRPSLAGGRALDDLVRRAGEIEVDLLAGLVLEDEERLGRARVDLRLGL